jgi:multidrug efflux pump subunit AcrA (membrane-fusion protein)
VKPRAMIKFLLIILVAIVGLNYVRVSLRQSALPPEPGRTPSLEKAPMRVYGLVEPLGREVFVGPLQPRRVTRILVTEGQMVTPGEPLCELEADVERQALQVAVARVAEFNARLDLILDDLARIQNLARSGAVTEFEMSQKTLEAKLLRRQIATAEAEVELKRHELATFILRSPLEGKLYKFDLRLGEQFTPQDYQRIVLGKAEKQVRLFIESFWIDSIRVGDRFLVRDGETLLHLGNGTVVLVADYVGARDFRTEDALERLDTQYTQAILQLDETAGMALGKLVFCERPEVAPPKAPSDPP